MKFSPQANDNIVRLAKIDEDGKIVDSVDLWRSVIVNPKIGTPYLSLYECEEECMFYVGIDIDHRLVTYCSRCSYFERGEKLKEEECQN